ncbi:MAG TPA: hypothetical protein VGI87_17140 [Solirubrobacteraceae bacterium]|jgi:hypothetical protein
MPEKTEEQIADLIAALRPVPAGWVQAAAELPEARTAIDQLVARALKDDAERRSILADLELALRQSGVEPRPHVVEQVRARLDEPA